MGKKIRSRGAWLASAYQNEGASEHSELEFRKRVLGLCPGHHFDENTMANLSSKLHQLIGKWCSETEQPEQLPIVRRLASAARFLEELARGLSGIETGMRRPEDTEFAVPVREALASKPGVGDLSRADEQLMAFREQCSEMSHVFLVAHETLKQDRGKRGRTKFDWYDDFTELLLEIAKQAHIEPNLNKDRDTGKRGGWLFEAAQALEYLLYPDMRSGSREACGKRLERSLRRLRPAAKS